MTFFRTVVAAVALMALAGPACATDRYYPDSYAVSPSGRFRIDAKSPDNAGPRARPFAESFVYTLTDTTTGKTIWQRKQPMTRSKGSPGATGDEPSPVQVFVHDTGLVVARTAYDSVIFLDGARGRKRFDADILRAFPSDEQDKFVSQTTAGPMWSQESDWFFVTIPASGSQPPRIYFVVRPYWNHRLIVDASTGKHVDLEGYFAVASVSELTSASEQVRTILAATLEEESQRAVAILAGAPARLKNDTEYYAYRDVVAALHTARFLKLTQTEPQLRSLEHAALNNNVRDSLQRKLRETLRALGKTPVGPYGPTFSVETRTANAREVSAGMSIGRVTELIGSPDGELYDEGRCYDYDIDAPEPYTLRLYLDGSGQLVLKTKTLTPFAFLTDPARMRGY